MSNRFNTFAHTHTGQAIIAQIDRPEREIEFRLLSRLDMPAVQALAWDVAPIFAGLASKPERDAASQFCGWYVGQKMREAGYDLIRERGRVVDAPFKTGAVWRRRGLSGAITS